MSKILFVLKKSDRGSLNIELRNDPFEEQGHFETEYKGIDKNGNEESKILNCNLYKYDSKNYFLDIGDLKTNINDIIEIIQLKISKMNNEFDYISFHPRSDTNENNIKLIETLNKNKRNQKFTFFSITDDKINDIKKLIEIVLKKVDVNNKCVESIYNLKIKLSSLKKVIEYENNLSADVKEDIKSINSTIKNLKKSYNSLSYIDTNMKKTIFSLDQNIHELDKYLFSEDQIYHKSH